MTSEILNEDSLTGIKMALVWTFNGFPFWSATIPKYYQTPTYIYVKSGNKCDSLDFLKYSCLHDTGDSWNPANYYGPSIIDVLGKESDAYMDLEKIFLPIFSEIEDDWSTNIKFFSEVQMSGSSLDLFKFPKNTWKVEFYTEDNFDCNYHDILTMSELVGIDSMKVKPNLRITYGPDPMLLNNSNLMYYIIPDRTETITSSEYKVQLDELYSEKILAIEFVPHGLGKISAINLPVGAWKLEDNPERHKSEFYVDNNTIENTKIINVKNDISDTAVDKLSGILVGTNKIEETPVKNLFLNCKLRSEKNNYYDIPWSSNIRYSLGDTVSYGNTRYISNINENIANNPILSGSWSIDTFTEGTFEEDKVSDSTVKLTTSGFGKLYNPTPNSDGTYTELSGEIGSTGNYVTVKIEPGPGYSFNGTYSYSFKNGSYVTNVKRNNKELGLYNINFYDDIGNSFYIPFNKISTTIVTEFFVSGINYYTYVKAGQYKDVDKTYTSLFDLPKAYEKISVSYLINSTHISGANTEEMNGVSINIPEKVDAIGKDLEVKYNNLLKYYDIVGISVNKDGSIPTYTEVDNTLDTIIPIVDSAMKITLTLIPKKICMELNLENENYESSWSGSYINVGESIDFLVYGSNDKEPIITLDGFKATSKTVTKSGTKTWRILVEGILGSGKININ